MQVERMSTVQPPMRHRPAGRKLSNCRAPAAPGNRHFQTGKPSAGNQPGAASTMRRSLKQSLLETPGQKTPQGPKTPTQPDASHGSQKWALFAHADRTDHILMSIGLFAAFVSGSSLPVINIVFANAVTALSNPNFPPHNVDMDSVVSIFWQLVGIAGWILVSEFLCIALLTHSAMRQTRVMREAVMEAIVYQELAWFDTNNPFSLSSDIGSTMVVIQDGLGRKLGQFVKHTTQVLMAMSVGIMRGWNVGLLIAATLPVFLIAILVFVSSVAKSTNTETDEFSSAAAIAEEALTSVSTVMAFNAQDSVLGRFKKFLYSGEDVYLKLSRIIAVAVAVIQFLSFVLYGYGLWIGGLIVASNDSVVPTMAKALPAIFVEITGLLAIGQAAPAMEALAASRAAANYIVEIEKQRSKIDCRSSEGVCLDDRGLNGSVVFKDVVFSYPTRPKDMVLKTCSFKISPGQRIALVGPSGSGKSTVISLLARLYDPAFGTITIDGHKIEKLQLRWLRSAFGVVRQEPVLFAASIMENVRYGRATATDAEVEQACRLAHAHDFITGLPEGYSTLLGANGGFLSAGQRQRLAIARAVVRKPRMLLLDEATVALDPKSGDVVQRAFDELIEREAVTTLIIAHRLSTLRKADAVFVMEDGRVSEQGKFDELASNPESRYCALFGGDAVEGDSDEMMQTRLTQIALLQSTRYNGNTTTRRGRHVSTDMNDTNTNNFFLATTYSTRASQYSSRQRNMLKSPAILNNPYASSDVRGSDIALLESMCGSQEFERARKDHRLSTVDSGTDKSPTLHQAIPVAVPVADVPADGDPSRSVTQKIIGLAAADRRYMIIGMLAALFNGIASPVTVVLRADMIQDLYRIEALKNNSMLRQAANKYFLMFLAVGFGIAISCFLQSLNFRLLGRNLTNRMRCLAFRSMMRQDLKWFDEPAHSAGALSGMLANDTAAVKIIAGEIQGRKTQNLIVITVCFILSCAIGSYLVALVFMGIVLVIVFSIMVDQRITWYAEEQGDRTLGSSSRIANEIIHNVQTITENNLQETILAEFRASLDLPTRVAIRSGYSSGLAIAFSQAVKWVGYGVLDYTGALFIQSGATNFKLFYRSFNLANASAMCIDETALFVSDEKSAIVAAERIFTLMENKPDIDIDDPNGIRPETVSGGLDVEVEEVEFTYPTVPDALVLKGMTFRAHGGETTAMMGTSDGGKSTLLQLLVRLYDVDEGSIFIDGIPIHELDVKWLRSNITIVPQDPVLFRLSVIDNIRLGNPTAKREDVIKVCETADAHGFISEMPNGYDTIVDSYKFSRGQKQRIAIARALLLKPRMLLLDEATSALDQDSQARIAASLRKLAESKECTVLAVTTQDSILQDAAQVLVASDGYILDEEAARLTQATKRGTTVFAPYRESSTTTPAFAPFRPAARPPAPNAGGHDKWV